MLSLQQAVMMLNTDSPYTKTIVVMPAKQVSYPTMQHTLLPSTLLASSMCLPKHAVTAADCSPRQSSLHTFQTNLMMPANRLAASATPKSAAHVAALHSAGIKHVYTLTEEEPLPSIFFTLGGPQHTFSPVTDGRAPTFAQVSSFLTIIRDHDYHYCLSLSIYICVVSMIFTLHVLILIIIHMLYVEQHCNTYLRDACWTGSGGPPLHRCSLS